MRAEKGHLRYILAPVHLLYTLLYPVDDKIRHNDACSATTVSNGVCFFWQRGEHMGEREGGMAGVVAIGRDSGLLGRLWKVAHDRR